MQARRAHLSIPQISLITALLAALLAAPLAGCGGASDSGTTPGVAPPTTAPVEPLVIEESDIVKKVGDRLYVQNPTRGLAVVDIADPRAPRLLGQGGVKGRAGELYLRGQLALVLLDEPSAACEELRVGELGWTPGGELALVDVSIPSAPRIQGRYCLPGAIAQSRLLGDFLYLVTSDKASGGSVVYSVDLRDPQKLVLAGKLQLVGDGREIHMTQTMLYVASKVSADCSSGWCDYQQGTKVSLVQLSAQTGAIRARGSVVVPGEPQGRFHMSARGDHFRIVTYDKSARHSLLSVIATAEADAPRVVAKLAVGGNEQLYATRFVGHRAYIVTFRRTDPLWVIDLEVPDKPTLLGELHVPGWSDFLFPRGDDRLLAVGRGDNGRGLGVSLFDVSDPRNPRAIQQLTFGARGWSGGGETYSEANVDHRAVSVFDSELPGGAPLLVVPYSTPVDQYSKSCRVEHRVQLIDVNRDSLHIRGELTQRGAVRRSLVHKTTLLTISDVELSSSDVSLRDRPRQQATLELGSAANADASTTLRCYQEDYYGMHDEHYYPFMCSLPRSGETNLGAVPISLLLLGALLTLRAWRRRG